MVSQDLGFIAGNSPFLTSAPLCVVASLLCSACG